MQETLENHEDVNVTSLADLNNRFIQLENDVESVIFATYNPNLRGNKRKQWWARKRLIRRRAQFDFMETYYTSIWNSRKQVKQMHWWWGMMETQRWRGVRGAMHNSTSLPCRRHCQTHTLCHTRFGSHEVDIAHFLLRQLLVLTTHR